MYILEGAWHRLLVVEACAHLTLVTEADRLPPARQKSHAQLRIGSTAPNYYTHKRSPHRCRLSTVAASAWRTKLNMALNISACSAVCLYAAATLAGTTQFVKAMTVEVAQSVSDPLLLMPA